jgi:type IV secretory pathway VirD2 relaxase
VVDAEALVQELLEAPAHVVAGVAGAHEHVRAQGREARGDLPDVQVVHLGDRELLAIAARPRRAHER